MNNPVELLNNLQVLFYARHCPIRHTEQIQEDERIITHSMTVTKVGFECFYHIRVYELP